MTRFRASLLGLAEILDGFEGLELDVVEFAVDLLDLADVDVLLPINDAVIVDEIIVYDLSMNRLVPLIALGIIGIGLLLGTIGLAVWNRR